MSSLFPTVSYTRWREKPGAENSVKLRARFGTKRPLKRMETLGGRSASRRQAYRNLYRKFFSVGFHYLIFSFSYKAGPGKSLGML